MSAGGHDAQREAAPGRYSSARCDDDAFMENLALVFAARLWQLSEDDREARLVRLHVAFPNCDTKDLVERVRAHIPADSDVLRPVYGE